MKIRFFIYYSIITTAFLSCNNSKYLDYYRAVNEGTYYFYQEKYEVAKTFYEKGLKKVLFGLDRDLYYYSICLWETGEKQQALSIIDTNMFCRVAMRQNYSFEDIDSTIRDSILSKNQLFLEKNGV